MEASAWDAVFPHLRDVLTVIDSSTIQAIAEGLFKESIRTCNHRILDLSLDLGADPTQRIRRFHYGKKRDVLFPPLVALYGRYSMNRLHSDIYNPTLRDWLSLWWRESHKSQTALCCGLSGPVSTP